MSYVAHVKASVRPDGDVIINVFQDNVWVAGGRTGHNVNTSVVSEKDFWNGVHEHAKQVVASKRLHLGRFTVVSDPAQAEVPH